MRYTRFMVCCAMILFAMKNQAQEESFTELVERLCLDEDTVDLSACTDLQLDEPRLAYVNISGVNMWPSSKTTPLRAWMEFYDGHGNYFKKRILARAQGNYTLASAKKNASFVLCDENWEEVATADIKFGKWVPQDSYHLKAFYTDYIRGIGEIGYKVYERMQWDRLPFWVRGRYSNDSQARCYPDAFPCIVYLNNTFQGIYAWQLKKSRRNMNQKKHTDTHIHLDGNIQNSSLFGGEINWKQFEVRNPDGLYDVLAQEYKRSSPRELIDANCDYFLDPDDDAEVRAGKVRSAKVKQCIQRLSRYHTELELMEKNGATAEQIRAEFEKRYDLASLLDYYILYYLIFNCDGSLKNWQWFTYDGLKWLVTPYDLDQTFGINLYGVIRPATLPIGDLTQGPFTWLVRYYPQAIKARYYELRNNHAIDARAIHEIIDYWMDRIGEDFYALEQVRWPSSPCYKDAECESGWEVCDQWELYVSAPNFVAMKDYKKGDVVKYEGRLWKATKAVSSKKPYTFNGNIDSRERLVEWVSDRIEYLDNLWGYIPSSLATTPAESGRMLIGVYRLDGMKQEHSLQRGLTIYRYSDGSARVSAQKGPR